MNHEDMETEQYNADESDCADGEITIPKKVVHFNRSLEMPKFNSISLRRLNMWTDIDSVYGIVDGLDKLSCMFSDKSQYTVSHMLNRRRVQTTSRIKLKNSRNESVGLQFFKNIQLFQVSSEGYNFDIYLTLIEQERFSFRQPNPYFTEVEMNCIASFLNVAKEMTLNDMKAKLSMLQNQVMEREDDHGESSRKVSYDEDGLEESSDAKHSDGDSSYGEDDLVVDVAPHTHRYESILSRENKFFCGMVSLRNTTDVLSYENNEWMNDDRVEEIMNNGTYQSSNRLKIKIDQSISSVQGLHNFRIVNESKEESKGVQHKFDKSALCGHAMRLFAHNFVRALKCIATCNKVFEEKFDYSKPQFTYAKKDLDALVLQRFALKVLFQGQFVFNCQNMKHISHNYDEMFIGEDFEYDIDDSFVVKEFNKWYEKETKKCHHVIQKVFSDQSKGGLVNFDIGLCIKSSEGDNALMFQMEKCGKNMETFVKASKSRMRLDFGNNDDDDDMDVDSVRINEEEANENDSILSIDHSLDLDELEERSESACSKDDDGEARELSNVTDQVLFTQDGQRMRVGKYPQLFYTEFGSVSLGSVVYDFCEEDAFFRRHGKRGSRDSVNYKCKKSIVSSTLSPGDYASAQCYCPQVKELNKAHEIKNLDSIQSLSFHGLNLLVDTYSSISEKDSMDAMRQKMNIIDEFQFIGREVVNQSSSHVRIEMYTCLCDYEEDVYVPYIDLTDFVYVTCESQLFERYMESLFRNISCIKKVFKPILDGGIPLDTMRRCLSAESMTYVLKCLEFTQTAISSTSHRGPITRSMWNDLKELKYYDVPMKHRRMLHDDKIRKHFNIDYGIDCSLLPLPKLNMLPSPFSNGLSCVSFQCIREGKLQRIVYEERFGKKRHLPFHFHSACQSEMAMLKKRGSNVVSFVESVGYVKSIVRKISSLCK